MLTKLLIPYPLYPIFSILLFSVCEESSYEVKKGHEEVSESHSEKEEETKGKRVSFVRARRSIVCSSMLSPWSSTLQEPFSELFPALVLRGKPYELSSRSHLPSKEVELDPFLPPSSSFPRCTHLLLSNEIADGGIPLRHRTRNAACFLGL